MTQPADLVPYIDDLPTPAVLDLRGAGPNPALQVIELKHARVQYTKQIVDSGGNVCESDAWAYNGSVPGPTFIVDNSQTIRVQWHNKIRDKHTLPFDVAVFADAVPKDGTDANLPTSCQCAAAAQRVSLIPPQNCPGSRGGQSDEAASALKASIVTHLHGGLTAPDSDGWAENVYRFGRSQFATYGKADLPDGEEQRAALLWYHDHGMGVTRLNVYAGLFGLWVLRDKAEDELITNGTLPSGTDELIFVIQDRNFELDAHCNLTGGLLHKTETSTAEMFGPYTLVNGKLWPKTDVNPGPVRIRILNGSNSRTYCLRMVKVGPDPTNAKGVVYTAFQKTENLPIWQVGSDGGLFGSPVDLSEPFNNVGHSGRAFDLTLAPAERVDLVVDFTQFAGQQLAFVNTAFAPFHGSTVTNPNRFNGDGTTGAEPDPTLQNPPVDAPDTAVNIQADDPGTAANPEKYLPFRLKYPHVIRFDVRTTAERPAGQPVPTPLTKCTTLDRSFRRYVHGKVTNPDLQLSLPEDHNHRWIALDENPTGNLTFRELVPYTTDPDVAAAAPAGVPLIPIAKMNGVVTWYRTVAKAFHDPASFFIKSGSCEIWNILNLTGDTHPVHVHLVQFQVLTRQSVNANSFQTPPGPSNAPPNPIKPIEVPRQPDANEQGFKDTVRANPGEIVQIAAFFNGYCGKYMYHCHILEHEDHDMMRPFIVVAEDAFNLMDDGMGGMNRIM